MVNALTWLSQAEREEVEEAIKQAEKSTRCEFVCALATRSSSYLSAVRWWSLVGAVVGLLCVGTLDHIGHAAGDWAHINSIAFVPALVGIIGGFLLVPTIINRLPRLLFMFVSEEHRSAAVDRAVSLLYGKHEVSHTEERVGMLLYLSLAERKFVIMADRGIVKVLGQDGLEELTKEATESLARGEHGKAFIKVLQSATERLKGDFPHLEGDQNELSDHLLAIHPHP